MGAVALKARNVLLPHAAPRYVLSMMRQRVDQKRQRSRGNHATSPAFLLDHHHCYVDWTGWNVEAVGKLGSGTRYVLPPASLEQKISHWQSWEEYSTWSCTMPYTLLLARGCAERTRGSLRSDLPKILNSNPAREEVHIRKMGCW